MLNVNYAECYADCQLCWVLCWMSIMLSGTFNSLVCWLSLWWMALCWMSVMLIGSFNSLVCWVSLLLCWMSSTFQQCKLTSACMHACMYVIFLSASLFDYSHRLWTKIAGQFTKVSTVPLGSIKRQFMVITYGCSKKGVAVRKTMPACMYFFSQLLFFTTAISYDHKLLINWPKCQQCHLVN